MSSKRKLKRRNPAPVAGFKYERMCQTVSEQAIYRVLAVAIDILWNDFGGLQRKDQRRSSSQRRSVSVWKLSTRALHRRSRQLWTSCSARLGIA